MAVSIAITPASGSVVSTVSMCRVDVSGMLLNDSTAYDVTKYPTEPAFTYYLSFIKGAVEQARSYVFSPSSDGKHAFNNYIFPSSGSWSIQLKNAASDANVDSALSVTVSQVEGSVGLKGHLAIKVIRANPSRWLRIKDAFAAVLRRLK